MRASPDTAVDKRPPISVADEALSRENQVKPRNTRLYFLVYCLAFFFDGFLLSFGGSIYVDLQRDLEVSPSMISWIYASMSIGFIVSNIACGYIADRVTNLHQIQSLLIFITSLCVISIPYNRHVASTFATMTMIGVGWAANETHCLLLVIRLYPTHSTTMLFLMAIVMNVFGGLVPLSIQLSISYTGSYAYPFLVFGCVGIAHSVSVLLLDTPQHDELRALKRQVSKTDTSASVGKIEEVARASADVLQGTPKHRRLQITTVALLMATMCFHGAIVKGLTAFITPYCTEYLHVDEQLGRYLITCYFYSCLLLRVCRQLCFANSNVVPQVVAAFVLGLALQMGFVLFVNGARVWLVFVLYNCIGLCTGAVLPGLWGWAESIRTTTGMIACLWWVSYGVGDAAITLVMGALSQNFGIRVLPIVVAVPMLLALLCVALAVLLFRALNDEERKVFDMIQNAKCPTADGPSVMTHGHTIRSEHRGREMQSHDHD